MSQKKNPTLFRILFLLTILTVISFIYLLFITLYQNQIFPGIRVLNIDLSGKTPAIAHQIIVSNFKDRIHKPLNLKSNQLKSEQSLLLDLTSAEPVINDDYLISTVYNYGRSDNFFKNLQHQLTALVFGVTIFPEVSYRRQDLLDVQLDSFNERLKQDPIDAKIYLGEVVTITPSSDGLILDKQTLLKQISDYLSYKSFSPNSIPLKSAQPLFTTTDAERYKKILEKVKQSPLKLIYQQDVFIIDQPTLFQLLNFNITKNNLASLSIDDQLYTLEKIEIGDKLLTSSEALVDEDKLAIFLQEFTKRFNQDAQDAKFTVEQKNTGQIKVNEFQPAKDGRKLDISKTARLIESALAEKQSSMIDLPVVITPAKVTTDSINNFGIKELLGEGVSHFQGSIENRIYNVGLAASRIHGVLVPPGQIFSFNNTVGEISGATGYKPAYVIKSGRTVLDDGGGVCQVSTTLFRAILNAGLPIVERTAHAYRVSYYEQGFPPGIDATVYHPTVDLKFKNDTPGYILIQTSRAGTDLYVDLYGTSDGRVAKLTKPVITNQTPPPPELRQDDPTLPRGQVKQVDWSAWGANVVFKRTVNRNGEKIIDESWRSNYRPWQAVFLVGIKD